MPSLFIIDPITDFVFLLKESIDNDELKARGSISKRNKIKENKESKALKSS